MTSGTELVGDDWYVSIFGQHLGPMPISELGMMAQKGELSPKDDVRSHANGEWFCVESIFDELLERAPQSNSTTTAPDSTKAQSETNAQEAQSGTKSIVEEAATRASRSVSSERHPHFSIDQQELSTEASTTRATQPNRLTYSSVVADSPDAKNVRTVTTPHELLEPSRTESDQSEFDQSEFDEPDLDDECDESDFDQSDESEFDSELEGCKRCDFFYWAESRENGPISYGELTDLVNDGHVAVGEFVKMDPPGQWVSNASIPGLIPQSDQLETSKQLSETEQSTSETVGCSLAATADISSSLVSEIIEETQQDASRSPTLVSDSSGPVQSAYKASKQQAFWGQLPQSHQRRTLTFDRNRVLLGTIIVAVVALAYFLFVRPTSDAAIYKSYVRIWTQFEIKKTNKTATADWKRFVGNSLQELEPILAQLKESASAENPAEQELYFAGNFLKQMLKSCQRHDAYDTEKKFKNHIARAKFLLTGIANLKLDPEFEADSI